MGLKEMCLAEMDGTKRNGFVSWPKWDIETGNEGEETN